jgi:hypothetical protein
VVLAPTPVNRASRLAIPGLQGTGIARPPVTGSPAAWLIVARESGRPCPASRLAGWPPAWYAGARPPSGQRVPGGQLCRLPEGWSGPAVAMSRTGRGAGGWRDADRQAARQAETGPACHSVSPGSSPGSRRAGRVIALARANCCHSRAMSRTGWQPAGFLAADAACRDSVKWKVQARRSLSAGTEAYVLRPRPRPA